LAAQPAEHEIRAATSHTRPFPTGQRAVTDEGLGLRPTAEDDADELFERTKADAEQDTALIAGSLASRGRPRRRVQTDRRH
jgi:hypothetical protein